MMGLGFRGWGRLPGQTLGFVVLEVQFGFRGQIGLIVCGGKG